MVTEKNAISLNTTRKTLITLAGHLLIFVQGIVLTPFIVKVAGPETFGVYTVFLAGLSFVYGISTFGVGVKAKRLLPSAEDKEQRADLFYRQFTFQLISIGILGFVLLLLYLTTQKTAEYESHGLFIWLIPAYLFAQVIYSQSADYYRYTHRIAHYNIATVLLPYLFLLMITSQFWLTKNLNAGNLVLSLVLAT